MIPNGLLHAPEAGVPAAGATVADATATHAAAGGSVGNPLYDVLPGHEAAILAVLALPILAWWLQVRRRDGSARAAGIVAGYDTLSPLDQLAIWAMAASAAIHLVLAPGHGGFGLTALFVGQAALLGIALRRALRGRPWRRLGGLVLAGSVVAYALAVAGGDLPDQVGLATKLIECVGLAAIARGATTTRRLAATAAATGVIALVVLTATAGWIGAVSAAGGGTTGHGHAPAGSAGAGYPTPGSVMPGAIPAAATAGERAAARDLHAALVAATARYADPAVAAADGYDVTAIQGTDHHAGNPAYESDGRILDPQRPENLIYASTPAGPVLLGAMFSMPAMQSGPMVGGPLTVWHAHEHVCLGLLPPGLSGLLSPLGGCPIGSVDVPVTNEMIHAWVVPGAPQAWGDLDDAWRASYLASLGSAD